MGPQGWTPQGGNLQGRIPQGGIPQGGIPLGWTHRDGSCREGSHREESHNEESHRDGPAVLCPQRGLTRSVQRTKFSRSWPWWCRCQQRSRATWEVVSRVESGNEAWKSSLRSSSPTITAGPVQQWPVLGWQVATLAVCTGLGLPVWRHLEGLWGSVSS